MSQTREKKSQKVTNWLKKVTNHWQKNHKLEKKMKKSHKLQSWAKYLEQNREIQ